VGKWINQPLPGLALTPVKHIISRAAAAADVDPNDGGAAAAGRHHQGDLLRL